MSGLILVSRGAFKKYPSLERCHSLNYLLFYPRRLVLNERCVKSVFQFHTLDAAGSEQWPGMKKSIGIIIQCINTNAGNYVALLIRSHGYHLPRRPILLGY